MVGEIAADALDERRQSFQEVEFSGRDQAGGDAAINQPRPNVNKFVRTRVWQWPQQRRIDGAEDRGRRGDAERERDERNSGKARRPNQAPHRVAEVLRRGFEPAARCHRPAPFHAPAVDVSDHRASAGCFIATCCHALSSAEGRGRRDWSTVVPDTFEGPNVVTREYHGPRSRRGRYNRAQSVWPSLPARGSVSTTSSPRRFIDPRSLRQERSVLILSKPLRTEQAQKRHHSSTRASYLLWG